MMYEYMELPDQTLITHSQLIVRVGQKTLQEHSVSPQEDRKGMAP